MRFKSRKTGGYRVLAVSGVNTISFAIAKQGANTKGLLGFAVERHDPYENERYFMAGFKVFKSVIREPDENTTVTTFEHPVQSFVWDDFTAKPGRRYEYFFYPIKGPVRNLDRTARPIRIKVRTEPLFSKDEHDIFFNRGVASSQAYARRFGNQRPDQMQPEKRAKAEEWLSRELDEAMLKFIAQAVKGDTLLCCFYEFRFRPVADALRAALDRKVTVRLIVDAKVNESTDKNGVFHESFPREENLKMIKAAGIPMGNVIKREARPSDIQHNKFMVLLKGAGQQPKEVWTGSTNISVGGIFGQTNVGHWVRNEVVAAQFQQYWKLLSDDPGGKEGDDAATKRTKNKAFRTAVDAISVAPDSFEQVQAGITPVFSARSDLKVLDLYVKLVDEAEKLACITLAFGIGKAFKEQLKDNTSQSHISFLLLEKEDKPNKRSVQPFIAINASQNVYKAWGSFLREKLHRWAKETSARGLGLNQHVAFIHSKFLLRDPLSDDPIVVTGSANFSEASTNANDENMLIIRGNRRVADIYFTEFNRLFNHYYFRSVMEVLSRGVTTNPSTQDSLFLSETDAWLEKYAPGTLRTKRVKLFTDMAGFED